MLEGENAHDERGVAAFESLRGERHEISRAGIPANVR